AGVPNDEGVILAVSSKDEAFLAVNIADLGEPGAAVLETLEIDNDRAGDGEVVKEEIVLRIIGGGRAVEDVEPGGLPGIGGERDDVVGAAGGGAGEVRLQVGRIDLREGDVENRVGMIIGECVVDVLEGDHVVQVEVMIVWVTA